MISRSGIKVVDEKEKESSTLLDLVMVAPIEEVADENSV